MAKEFTPSVRSAKGEPAQSDMGASVINYGEQRYGAGVKDESLLTYAEPGDEGSTAVMCQKDNGGISGSEHFEGPMQGTPTGK